MHPDENSQAAEQKKICPCCGSADVWFKQEPQEYTPPFGKTVQYETRTLHCTACGESVSAESDPHRIAQILAHADLASVGPMLDTLEIHGYSQVSIKRILHLTDHYTANWRTGAPESIIALLRILAKYPWILSVHGCVDYPVDEKSGSRWTLGSLAEDIGCCLDSYDDLHVIAGDLVERLTKAARAIVESRALMIHSDIEAHNLCLALEACEHGARMRCRKS